MNTTNNNFGRNKLTAEKLAKAMKFSNANDMFEAHSRGEKVGDSDDHITIHTPTGLKQLTINGFLQYVVDGNKFDHDKLFEDNVYSMLKTYDECVISDCIIKIRELASITELTLFEVMKHKAPKDFYSKIVENGIIMTSSGVENAVSYLKTVEDMCDILCDTAARISANKAY